MYKSARAIDISTVDDVGHFNALYVGTTAGNIAIIDEVGNAVTIIGAAVGTVIPIAGRQVTKTGTTAVGITAFN